MELYDSTFGHFFISNRIVIPFFIFMHHAGLYGMMFLFFFEYNDYWCNRWLVNGGNSKLSYCPEPQPNTLSTYADGKAVSGPDAAEPVVDPASSEASVV